MSERDFVGGKRHDLVEGLVETFKSVCEGEGSRVTVLSATTGQGKTRIVQEFYSQLASSQDEPRYWPDRLNRNEDDRWTDSRKCITPKDFEVASDTEIPWVWWGLNCHKRPDGRFTQALFDDATQLGAHAGALYERMRKEQKTSVGIDSTIALLDVLGLLGLAIVPPVGIAMMSGGLLKTLWDHRELNERFKKWIEDRKENRQIRHLDAEFFGREEDIGELARRVARITENVPMVVAIDDIHWADQTLMEFLTTILMDPKARIFIIATAWPTSEKEFEMFPFFNWLNENSGKKTLMNRVHVHSLEPLEDDELDELIELKYKRISNDRARRLTKDECRTLRERYGSTPMWIEAVFGLPRVREDIKTGVFSSANNDRLPRDLESALRDYWDEIPVEAQSVLAIASVGGQRFLPVPVVAAAAAQGIKEARKYLLKGKDVYGFISGIDQVIETFIDPIFWETAEGAADELFTLKQKEDFKKAVAEYAISVIPEEGSSAGCDEVWSAHVAMAMEGFVGTQEAAISSAKLAELRYRRKDYFSALDDIKRAIDWTPDLSSVDFHSWVVLHFELLVSLGREFEAAETLSGYLPKISDIYGISSGEYKHVKIEFAELLIVAEKFEEAFEILQELRTEATEEVLTLSKCEVAGSDVETFLERFFSNAGLDDTELVLTETWLRVMKGWAQSCHIAGESEVAINVMTKILKVLENSIDVPFEIAHVFRNDLAQFILNAEGSSTRLEEVLPMQEQLVIEAQREFGESSGHYFTARWNLLVTKIAAIITQHLKRNNGEVRIRPGCYILPDYDVQERNLSREIEKEIMFLLGDMIPVRGPTNSTVQSIHSELLAFQMISFENEYLTFLTLRARSNLYFLKLYGFDPTSTPVLNTLKALCEGLFSHWRYREALFMLEPTLDILSSRFSKDHPKLVEFTELHEWATQNADRLDGIIENSKIALEEQLKSSGEVDSQIIDNWLEVAGMLETGFRSEEAIVEYERLLAVQEKTSGNKTREAMSTRKALYLAIMHRYTPHEDEGFESSHLQGLRLLLELMVDQLEVLGPSDPDTMETREMITPWLESIEADKDDPDLYHACFLPYDEVITSMEILTKDPDLLTEAFSGEKASPWMELRDPSGSLIGGGSTPYQKKINTEAEKTPRNSLCHCGSGRKFKHCHGSL